jgi:hypothetical protein
MVWTILPRSFRRVSVKVTAKYTYRPPRAEADRMMAESRKVQAEINALEKLPPEVAKERQVWIGKTSEAIRAGRKPIRPRPRWTWRGSSGFMGNAATICRSGRTMPP